MWGALNWDQEGYGRERERERALHDASHHKRAIHDMPKKIFWGPKSRCDFDLHQKTAIVITEKSRHLVHSHAPQTWKTRGFCILLVCLLVWWVCCNKTQNQFPSKNKQRQNPKRKQNPSKNKRNKEGLGWCGALQAPHHLKPSKTQTKPQPKQRSQPTKTNKQNKHTHTHTYTTRKTNKKRQKTKDKRQK